MRDNDDDDRGPAPRNDRPTRPSFPDPGHGEGPPPSRSLLWYGAFLLLGVGVGSLGIMAGTYMVSKFRGDGPGLDPNAQLRPTTPAAPLDAEEHEAVSLFETVKDSVVNVDVVMLKQGRWDEQPTELQTSGGSGFVWDASGHVVTNFHVVAESLKAGRALRVVLADRTAYTATLVGTAQDSDLAVLRITAPKEKLKPIQVGTSDDLKVGQKVYAIGNPFGLSLTMTKGIISSLNRIIESPSGVKIPKAIQTDAAINPGNSGGPLLDKSGRLVGVNTSIATPNGGNVGIGFSIPVDAVNVVVTDLIRTGRSLRPDLGVKLYDERRLRQARYDHGVMIDRVISKGPADAAGLKGCTYNNRGVVTQAGDLIIAINGEPIANVEDYERVVRGLKVGAEATVKIVRFPTKELEVPITVGGV